MELKKELFCEDIRKEILIRKISSNRAAQQSDVSRSTMKSYIKGDINSDITVKNYLKICNWMNKKITKYVK